MHPWARMTSEDGMECPVCWEGFNDAENTPHVLWCGHSLCRNCVTGLQWAMIKLPFSPIRLPLFIACPWCQFLTLRMTWKGILKYPCKNFFLLWIVESLKGGQVRQRPQVDAATTTALENSPPPAARSVPNVILNLRPRHQQQAEHQQQQQRTSGNYLVVILQGVRARLTKNERPPARPSVSRAKGRVNWLKRRVGLGRTDVEPNMKTKKQ